VTLDPVTVATSWAQQLPREFARELAAALRAGTPALHALQAKVALPASSAAVRAGLALARQGDGPFAAGVLTGQLDSAGVRPNVVPVWTGPASKAGHGRLTVAVVADLIAESEQELVLASYATVPGDSIRQALFDAVDRGVALTLLLERQEDNPKFHGQGEPFPGLPARRLAWPVAARPPDASMHAKVLVVDRRTALVGSANLTGYALERNLECGLLVRGGQVPALLADHLLSADGLEEA
jgi:phosphatidylserine/phosphatidylglycerophosphate/cardiolipin synthase-like enzyme